MRLAWRWIMSILFVAVNAVMMLLMGIGASPGSTGGGVKTTSFAVLVIAGIIANAGITGVLSNHQGRYGARVLWLLAGAQPGAAGFTCGRPGDDIGLTPTGDQRFSAGTRRQARGAKRRPIRPRPVM